MYKFSAKFGKDEGVTGDLLSS